jgi:hypothetical protein
MTDWKAYTPTLKGQSNGLAYSNTTTVGKYRRVGDSLEVQLTSSFSGTPTTGTGNFIWDIPSGLSVDTAKLSDTNKYKNTLGTMHILDSGLNTRVGVSTYDGASGSITASAELGTANLSPIVPITFTTSDSIALSFSVPIQGWSSNAVSSEDLGGREIVVRGAGNGGQSITGTTTDIPFSEIEDTSASWDGTLFKAPETGYYAIDGGVRWSSGLGQILFYAFINGVQDKMLGYEQGTNVVITSLSGKIKLNKGQELSIRSDQNITLINVSGQHHIHIQKLASPQTILETETVAARYTSSNNQILTNSNQITLLFENKNADTHGAMNIITGEYTIPVSGFYQINGRCGSNITASSATFALYLVLNGLAIIEEFETTDTVTNTRSVRLSELVYLDKGSVIRLDAFQNSGSSVTVTVRRNSFSIARIK